MRKKYDILKTERGLAIITLNNNRLDEVLFDVQNDLCSRNYSGKVLFDLLLTNGQARNRFVETTFNGVQFDARNINVIGLKNVGINTLSMISQYHLKHIGQIRESYLSSLQKSKIVENLQLVNS